MAPSRYDWKIVDWDVKPQHNQPTNILANFPHCKALAFYAKSVTFAIVYVNDISVYLV